MDAKPYAFMLASGSDFRDPVSRFFWEKMMLNRSDIQGRANRSSSEIKKTRFRVLAGRCVAYCSASHMTSVGRNF
jgi:hypothetical protein